MKNTITPDLDVTSTHSDSAAHNPHPESEKSRTWSDGSHREEDSQDDSGVRGTVGFREGETRFENDERTATLEEKLLEKEHRYVSALADRLVTASNGFALLLY